MECRSSVCAVRRSAPDATRFVPYQCLIRCAVPPLIPARGTLAAVKTMTIRDDA